MPFSRTRQIFSSAVSADGDWIFVGDSTYKSIHYGPLEVDGIVELRMSNSLALPGAADQESALLAAVTSVVIGFHSFYNVPESMRWLRFRKTTAGGTAETTLARLHERVET